MEKGRKVNEVEYQAYCRAAGITRAWDMYVSNVTDAMKAWGTASHPTGRGVFDPIETVGVSAGQANGERHIPTAPLLARIERLKREGLAVTVISIRTGVNLATIWKWKQRGLLKFESAV